MSLYVHADVSLNSLRTWIRADSSSELRFRLIIIVRGSFSVPKLISLVGSSTAEVGSSNLFSPVQRLRFQPPKDQLRPLPLPPTHPVVPAPPVRQEDKGKAPLVGEPSRGLGARDVCYRCGGFGHYVGQCPSRALHIGELTSDPQLVETSEIVFSPPIMDEEEFVEDSEAIECDQVTWSGPMYPYPT